MRYGFLPSFAVAIFGLFLDTTATHAQNYVELHSWYSSSRTDNAESTSPTWRGSTGETRSPDYRWSRIEGRVVAAPSDLPDLLPLHSWYSPGRTDNHTTTEEVWQGGPGQTRSPDYRWYRLEGYAFRRPIAGTMPLMKWWSSQRKDNDTTSSPAWLPTGVAGESRSPGYTSFRQLGWVMPPRPTMLAQADNPSRFGFASRRVVGTRPLVLVLVNFANAPLSQAANVYQQRVFGPSGLNVIDYFSAMSNGAFTFTPAGTVTVNLPASAWQVPLIGTFDAQLLRAVSAAGFNFQAFDADGDGTVRSDELAFLAILPNFDADGDGTLDAVGGGQNRGFPTVSVGGTQVSLQGAMTNEMGDLKLLGHELIHQLGIPEHTYGPGRTINFRATVMAASDVLRADGSSRPVGLDPYNAMQLGWVSPRIVPITRAGGNARIAALQNPATRSWQAPILFYDPARGTDEFFIAQYRDPSPAADTSGGYDNSVPSAGLALWYIQRRAAQGPGPVTFNWPPPFARPVPGGDMFANYFLSNLGGSDGSRQGNFYTARDGIISVPWGDGTDSGLRMVVGDRQPSSVDVTWFHRDQLFLPRIDRVFPATATAGQTVSLSGAFPVPPMDVFVGLRLQGRTDGLQFSSLEVVSQSASRLVVRLPSALPRGTHLLTARMAQGRLTTSGNWARVTAR